MGVATFSPQYERPTIRGVRLCTFTFLSTNRAQQAAFRQIRVPFKSLNPTSVEPAVSQCLEFLRLRSNSHVMLKGVSHHLISDIAYTLFPSASASVVCHCLPRPVSPSEKQEAERYMSPAFYLPASCLASAYSWIAPWQALPHPSSSPDGSLGIAARQVRTEQSGRLLQGASPVLLQD